ncbi:MAG: GIY-YIG nuclease family protein [Burkholderiales bacterium]|nr:GIY-YIG nuclease family protein [Burkholderiales bacterium]
MNFPDDLKRTITPTLSAKATSLGFPEPVETSGLRSVAHLFGAGKPRCGIYFLALPDSRSYIGQAVDVVRRFSQHVRAHGVIEAFSFLHVARGRLDVVEREFIYKAETAGLILVNVDHVADVVGESDLNDLLTDEQLQSWSASPYEENLNDLESKPIKLSSSQHSRYERNVKQFCRHPLAKVAALELFLYLDSCIPYPRLTEYTFWSVSCMPSTNKTTWPRLLCVSAGVMELFCIGTHKDPSFSFATWGFINVASDVLLGAYGTKEKFLDAYPQVELRAASYRDAGQQASSLFAQSQLDMLAMLEDPAVTRAAAVLAMRIMRKRSTIYFKFHCPQLVDLALQHRDGSEEDLDSAIDSELNAFCDAVKERFPEALEQVRRSDSET